MTDPVEIRPDNASIALDDPRIEEQIRREFWYRGDLRPQLRRHGQSAAYRFVKKLEREAPSALPIVIETHRRFGKSHFMCMLACERALSQPGAFIKYAAPGKEQCQKIVIPNLMEVLRYCPKELRPRRVRSEFYFRNPRWEDQTQPSVLQIEGVNDDPDSLRGTPADLALFDEAGYMEKIEYVWRDVVLPMFVGRQRPTAVFASTPPPSMAHPWITKFIAAARAQKRYFLLRGSDNEDFSDRDRRMLLEVHGSEDSKSWKREIECEHVTDEESLICPEFLEAEKHIVVEHERPTWFRPVVVADLGWKDFSHILFAYVDFKAQKLIIEDEIRVHYETPGQLAERWLDKERELWGHTPPQAELWPQLPARYKRPFSDWTRRYADTPLLTLEGLNRDHGLRVQPVLKFDRDRAIASMRQKVKDRKILIHPRCRDLIYQLRHGVWDEKRKRFASSEELGHCDGIAALHYLNRQAPWRDNPYPGERPHGRNIVADRRAGPRARSAIARAFGG